MKDDKIKNKFRTATQILTDIKIERFKKKFGEREDPNGKKVRIKTDDYVKRIKDGELSQNFIEYLEDNKDRIFTAKSVPNSKIRYTFVEDETWIFTFYDLEIIE